MRRPFYSDGQQVFEADGYGAINPIDGGVQDHAQSNDRRSIDRRSRHAREAFESRRRHLVMTSEEFAFRPVQFKLEAQAVIFAD